jgi:hypothetical protein
MPERGATEKTINWYRQVLPKLRDWLPRSQTPRFGDLRVFEQAHQGVLEDLKIDPDTVKKKLWNLLTAYELSEGKINPDHLSDSMRKSALPLAISIRRGELGRLENILPVTNAFSEHTAAQEFSDRISISLPLSEENKKVAEEIGRKLSVVEVIRDRTRQRHAKIFDNLGIPEGEREELSNRLLFASLWKIAGEYIHTHAYDLRKLPLDRRTLDSEVNTLLKEMSKKIEAVSKYSDANYKLLRYSGRAIKALNEKADELTGALSDTESMIIDFLKARDFDPQSIKEVISKTTTTDEKKKELERVALINQYISNVKKVSNQIIRSIRTRDGTQELEALKDELKVQSEEIKGLIEGVRGAYKGLPKPPVLTDLKRLDNVSESLKKATGLWKEFKGMQNNRKQRWEEHAHEI